uniref:Uncharacterized protein n=1 Tax=Solanum lycopersicum TaxID=4081 RepID=A0A3Q7I144_SOLLC
MSSTNGEGPSLHTGGSVAFAEYKRNKELTGKELPNDELILKTHKTKKEKKWISGELERMWIQRPVGPPIIEISTKHQDLKDEAYTINSVRASEQDFISISSIFEFRYEEAHTMYKYWSAINRIGWVIGKGNMEAQVNNVVPFAVAQMLGFTLNHQQMDLVLP